MHVLFRIGADFEAIAKEYRLLASDLRDWRAAWRAILPRLAAGLQAVWFSAGAELGERWPELKPETVRRKEREGRGRSMLLYTERLLRTISSPTRGKRSLTKKRVAFGPKDRYAFVQHYGSKERGIPPRPFIGITKTMEGDITTLMDAHARAVIAKAEQKIALLCAASQRGS